MAGKKGSDRGRVAALVEHVGAQDHIEWAECGWVAPVADDKLEGIRRPAAIAGAGRHEVERAWFPVQESDARAASRRCEPARAKSAAEVESPHSVEGRAEEEVRDERFRGGPDRAEVGHPLVAALEFVLRHAVEKGVRVVRLPEAERATELPPPDSKSSNHAWGVGFPHA